MSNTNNDQKRQPNRRNPFGSVVSHLPIAGAMVYGVYGVYRDIKANSGSFATPPTTSKKAAEGIKNMRIKSAAAAAAVAKNAGPDAKRALLESLGGSFGDDSVKRLALSYAAMVSDPSISLTREHMTSSLFKAQTLVKDTLRVGGDRTGYALQMQNMINKMSDYEATAFHRKWEMVSPSRFESNIYGFGDSPYGALPRRKGLGGVDYSAIPGARESDIRHIDITGHSTFYKNLGFLSGGQEMTIPDTWSRDKMKDSKRVLKRFGLENVGGVKAMYLTKINRGKDKFFDLQVHFAGSKDPFRFILSGAGGHRAISPKSMGSFVVGGVAGELNKGINSRIKDVIVRMGGMSGFERTREYREFYETMYKIGQFEPGGLDGGSAGQRLRSAIARNIVWDPESLKINETTRTRAHYGLTQMESFMKANPGFEAVSPGTMTKGGFINMAKFQLAGSKTNFNLMELFKDQENFDRSNRIFQMMRDLSWTPTRSAVASWGLRGPESLKDLELLKTKKMGPAGALQRFRPVNAGKTFDKLLIEQMGYVTPGSVVLGELVGRQTR